MQGYTRAIPLLPPNISFPLQ